MNIKRIRNLLILICLIVTGVVTSANAQITSPTPTDPSSPNSPVTQQPSVVLAVSDAIPLLLKSPKMLEKLLIQLDYERNKRIQAERERDQEREQKVKAVENATTMEKRATEAEAALVARQDEGKNLRDGYTSLQTANSELIKDNMELKLENKSLRGDRWKYGLIGTAVGGAACLYLKRN